MIGGHVSTIPGDSPEGMSSNRVTDLAMGQPMPCTYGVWKVRRDHNYATDGLRWRWVA